MTTEPANTPLPRKRRLWRWLLLAVGLLVLFPIAVVYSLNWYGERRFQAELDKIRDRGEPVDAADLDALRKHPDLDLTDIYLGASKGFGSRAGFDGHDDDIDDFEVVPIVGYLEPWPLPGEKWAKIEVSEKFLKRARGQLIMIHDAVSRNGDAWIQLNFRDGVGMDSQHQIYLRSAVKWLALEAWYHAFRGKNSDAAQSIHAGFRITNIFANEPFALSVLIRRALHELILNAIKSLLTSVAWQDSELSRFQENIRASIDG